MEHHEEMIGDGNHFIGADLAKFGEHFQAGRDVVQGSLVGEGRRNSHHQARRVECPQGDCGPGRLVGGVAGAMLRDSQQGLGAGVQEFMFAQGDGIAGRIVVGFGRGNVPTLGKLVLQAQVGITIDRAADPARRNALQRRLVFDGRTGERCRAPWAPCRGRRPALPVCRPR